MRAALTVALAAGLVATAAAASPRPSAPRLEGFRPAGLTLDSHFRDGRPLARVPLSQLRRRSWGGVVTAADSEQVTVYVSDAYPVDPARQQGIADFLTQLYHGSELASMSVYVAPLTEVQALCGAGAGGCYGHNLIVAPGEDLPSGTSPENVLAHEYGHHVAANRNNAPWDAYSWGPKRWASAERICSRVAQGTAFPGDEGEHYRQNPGEAWAESYRLLNYERQAWPHWTPIPWRVVDDTFLPDAATLDAAREDVLDPWERSDTATPWRGRLRNVAPKGKPVHVPRVRRAVATPLDGTLALIVPRAPRGMTLSVSTLNGKFLAGSDRPILPAPICGERLVVLTVRSKRPGRFAVDISAP